MADFKVGDKVRCINDMGYSISLTVDKIYTVINPCNVGIRPHMDMICVVGDSGVQEAYYTERFELANSTSVPVVTKDDLVQYIFEEWKDYMAEFHSSSTSLETILKKAGYKIVTETTYMLKEIPGSGLKHTRPATRPLHVPAEPV